jgi:hypothetical protein
VAAEFGVSTEQVLRDHAISHVLGALTSMDGADDLVFWFQFTRSFQART